MTECKKLTEKVISYSTMAVIHALAAGSTAWLGRSITLINFSTGAGFGALLGIIAWGTMHFFSKHVNFISDYLNIDEDWITMPLSYVTSGVVVYAGSLVTASCGLTAPISVPTAAIMTVASFGSLYLFSILIQYDCCSSPQEKKEA